MWSPFLLFPLSIVIVVLLYILHRHLQKKAAQPPPRRSRLKLPDPDKDPQEHARQTVRVIMKAWARNESGEGIKRSLIRSGLVDADGADVFMGITQLMTESMQHSDPQKLHDELVTKGVPEPVIMGAMAALIEYLGEQEGKEGAGDSEEAAASQPPDSAEAFARLKVLHRVVVYGLVNPPKEVVDKVLGDGSEAERAEFDAKFKSFSDQAVADLKKAGAWEAVSPKERAFLESYGSKIGDQARTDAIWRKEALAMLLWALGLTPDWPAIDQEYSPDDLKKLGQIAAALKGPPQLRPREEISEKRDLIEMWHWRVRTRQLIDEKRPFPSDENMKKAGFKCYDDIVRFTARKSHEEGDLARIIDDDFVFDGKAFRALSADEYQLAGSIIRERHCALNWLCGLAPGNRWDETPTDT
ncbi:MAG TPA: DUF4272 domain-containing protein [Planctomycetota bacterium]|nr:DUF4272 domain-containing protein [Planctomycetota bacterium]